MKLETVDKLLYTITKKQEDYEYDSRVAAAAAKRLEDRKWGQSFRRTSELSYYNGGTLRSKWDKSDDYDGRSLMLELAKKTVIAAACGLRVTLELMKKTINLADIYDDI
jgi:hypothetical protein